MGKTDFFDQFRKIIIRHKRIGYDINVMQQSACLAVNPITDFAALFNCTLFNSTCHCINNSLFVFIYMSIVRHKNHNILCIKEMNSISYL